MSEELWCVHVYGPDDLIPVRSKESAESRAAYLNGEWEKILETKPEGYPRINAVVEVWPYDEASHSEALLEEETQTTELYRLVTDESN